MSTADALRHDVKVIGLVGVAHGLSHFFQIATAVLFPLIKDELGVSYAALGATVGLYYTVSAVCQTLAGFAVDRFGARRVLFAGLGMAIAGAALAGLAQNYAMLLAAAVVGGIGNSVFHPVDFTILNARVTQHRLGYAFSWHGIAGYLGFAAAPAYGIAMATAFDWRAALLGAAAIGAVVTALLAVRGGELQAAPVAVRVRPLKSLWGSLDTRDCMTLDLALALAPPAALKYVVIHELCHLKIRNHSPRYWNLVGSLYPDWKEQRVWLREKGHALKAELARLIGS